MRLIFSILLSSLAAPALAGPPVVEGVTAMRSGDLWSFSVTVRHADTGWDHYADGWEVIGPGGERLAYRKLLHPHVNEQPFTRSLSGVEVPGGTSIVEIRAHDSVHGWGEPYPLRLEQ